MSVDATREFVDANILVYANDASAGDKKRVASELLSRLWESRTGCLSVQVLQEFYVTVTGKLPTRMPTSEAIDRIDEWANWHVFSPTATDVVAAIRLQTRRKLSFWDAMVVQAASELGCDILWTEDLNDGQLIDRLRIRNPFIAPQAPAEPNLDSRA